MRKIINITFVLCLIGLIIINFIDIKDSNNLKVLVSNNLKLNDAFDSFYSEYHIDIDDNYYYDENELVNILKTNEYDLIICNKIVADKIINNHLVNKIDKDQVLNYRNIKNDYLYNNEYFIEFLAKSPTDIYVLFTKTDKAYNLMEYLLQADVSADIVVKNDLYNINWAADYYLSS